MRLNLPGIHTPHRELNGNIGNSVSCEESRLLELSRKVRRSITLLVEFQVASESANNTILYSNAFCPP